MESKCTTLVYMTCRYSYCSQCTCCSHCEELVYGIYCLHIVNIDYTMLSWLDKSVYVFSSFVARFLFRWMNILVISPVLLYRYGLRYQPDICHCSLIQKRAIGSPRASSPAPEDASAHTALCLAVKVRWGCEPPQWRRPLGWRPRHSWNCWIESDSWLCVNSIWSVQWRMTSVTKLLVIEQLLHPALKSTVSAPWHNFHLFPSSQQILATSLVESTLNSSLSWSWSGKLD